jgi:hypothetical protein
MIEGSAARRAFRRPAGGFLDRDEARYTGWERRNLPKWGTVNAIRPRSEL